MIDRFKKYMSVTLALLLAVVAPTAAFANSTTSNTVQVPVNLSIPESVSLSVSSNTLTLTNTVPSSTIQVTASWQIATGHTTAKIYAYFTTIPFCPTCGGAGINPSQLSTTFNSGTAIACNQPSFDQNVAGVPGQNCGTFAFPNIGTDLNDSQQVQFTLTGANSIFQSGSTTTAGTYGGGQLNLVFEVV